MRSTRVTSLVAVAGVVLGSLVSIAYPAQATESSAGTSSSVLLVPTNYSTIQSAVDAAAPGAEIKVRPGTYREQLSIAKNVTIVGAGPGVTTIVAPKTLAAGLSGRTSIIEIHDGATVAMSRLTVAGPGEGSCGAGSLQDGIQVLGGAHLDLSYARVSHIHDSPAASCPRSGIGVRVGTAPTGAGSATISHTQISDYQYAGVVVVSSEASAALENNVIVGHHSISTTGVEFVLGATGTIADNAISANACHEPDPNCGPDVLSDAQEGGIIAGAGTVVTDNLLYGNQVGIIGIGAAQISGNRLFGNQLYGISLQDGEFALSHDHIVGGAGGVAVVAFSTDTHATLDGVTILHTSGAAVQTFQCCGFSATATIQR